ncbi:MAG: hypothetical protein HQL95_05615 [Magnetococcales bacterium]|nr:hypothetical protein [Magnetococcales bacterium]
MARVVFLGELRHTEVGMSGNGDWISWLVLIGGTVLTLLGIIKVMANSARILVWMLLLVVGVGGMAHGIRQHPTILESVGVPADIARTIRGFLVSSDR